MSHKNGKYIKCNVCGELHYYRKSQLDNKRGKYCSVKCANIAREGEGSWNWEGGKSFEEYPSDWNRRFKESIRIRDLYTCQVCGISQSECSRSLAVHHIDRDKNNLTKDNLISLCDSCHAKEHWKEKLIRKDNRYVRT